MHLIFVGLTILLIMVNFSAAGVITQRWVNNYPIAKISAVLGICLTLFFIEHFIGLGSLEWLWPITTCASLYVLSKKKVTLLKSHLKYELVFFIGLIYGLMWRFAFPDINGSSEDLTDLAFLSNYYAGQTLPPVDNWLPPYQFDFYYAFQQYSGALLGRWLGLPVGMTYNFAFAVLIACFVSLVWNVASFATQKYLPRILLVTAVVMGGTGVSPFAPFMYQSKANTSHEKSFESVSRLWASVRFIGKYDERVSTDFGKTLVTPEQSAYKKQDLPLETIGYLTLQGDFHPPLGGFLLVIIAISCILLIERAAVYPQNPHAPPTTFAYQAILVATGPLMWITNTWVLPLQSLLIFSWIGYRLITKNSVNWQAVLLGGLIPLLLMLPFLNQFTDSALSLSIKSVESTSHTPLLKGILLFWPLLLLLFTGLFIGKKQPIAWFFVAVLGCFLVMSEMLYVDDPQSGLFERFNTTLKWWSWLQVAILVSLSTILMANKHKLIRGVNLVLLLALSSYALELAYYFKHTAKPAKGKLKGEHFITKNTVNNQILNYLKAAPYGVVLEHVDRAAYSQTSAYALFSNKPSLVGWYAHESQWRGEPSFIRQRGYDAQAFYKGQLNNSLAWLLQNNVRYIVWSKNHNNSYQKIHQQIKSSYHFVMIKNDGKTKHGLWVLKEQYNHASELKD